MTIYLRPYFGPEISIGHDSEFAAVRLTLDSLPGETFEDRDVERLLTASEARELAAMLWHHADEQDRRFR